MRRGLQMRESVFETLVGFLVVGVAAVFAVFAVNNGTDGQPSSSTYDVTARFNNVAGITRGADVRLAGVKIGIVKAIEADFERAEALVTLSVPSNLELADDTDARITADGLLGGSYIALEQGGGFDVIAKDGTGEIVYTRGSVDLLTLVGSFASSLNDDGDDAPSGE